MRLINPVGGGSRSVLARASEREKNEGPRERRDEKRKVARRCTNGEAKGYAAGMMYTVVAVLEHQNGNFIAGCTAKDLYSRRSLRAGRDRADEAASSSQRCCCNSHRVSVYNVADYSVAHLAFASRSRCRDSVRFYLFDGEGWGKEAISVCKLRSHGAQLSRR